MSTFKAKIEPPGVNLLQKVSLKPGQSMTYLSSNKQINTTVRR